MTAKDIYSLLLKTDFWAKEISQTRFPFIKKMATPPTVSLFKEVTVRIDTEELTRFGKPKPQRRRFDGIGLIKPHYKAYGEELMTVGFEIKVSKSDLLNDNKYTDYIGYCNYNYFVVTSALVDFAKQKLENDFKHFGIIDIEAKKIVSMCQFQQVEVANAEALFREILFNKSN